MPTIDQLAPAASASDADELVVSQGGIARKITRAQVLNGVQPQLAISSGVLLGRSSTGVGSPETISVGQNLVLQSGTLTATGTAFTIANLPSGTVPAASDLLPILQGGSTASVSFAQIVSGLSIASNLNISQATVTPTGTATASRLSDLTAATLMRSGGTLTGPVILYGPPNALNEAASKSYVDQKMAAALPLSGGSLLGTLTLAVQPTSGLDAATKSYVDTVLASSVPVSGGTMSGLLSLSADPALPLGAATKRYVDTKVARTGDTLTGVLMLAADPTAAQQAATKNYVDNQVATSLAKSGGTVSGAILLAGDPTYSAQAATKQYVDQRLYRAGDTLTGPLTLAADPTLASQAATKSYVDAKAAASVSRGGDSMIGSLLLASDPAAPLQASTKQYTDLKVARTGDTLLGALTLAADPTSPLQATTKQYVDRGLATTITSAGATFLGPVVLASDPSSPAQASTKQYVDTRVLRSGDTLTGVLALSGDPVSASQAATKNYVDNQTATRLAITGGTMAGLLQLGSDPILAAHAATKHYVDGQVATVLPLAGGTISGMLTLANMPTAAQGAANKGYVDAGVATALPLTGGTLSGSLVLAASPVIPMQAATKSYVDMNPGADRVINVAMPPYGAKIDGVTDDTTAFKAAYQAATAGSVIYVPNGTVVLQSPSTWGIALTKTVKWIVDGTILTDGTPLGSSIPNGSGPSRLTLPGIVFGNSQTSLTAAQGGSTATDFAVNQSSYIVNHTGGTSGSVATNSRNDTIIYASPNNYIWGGLDRLIWAGTQTPTPSTPAQHVGRYIQTVRQVASTGSNGQVLPQPSLWAACLEYRDATGNSSSVTGAASLTIEMDWFGNGLDDANIRQIQSLVIGQDNKSGAPIEVSTIIGAYLDASSTGSAKNVFTIGVPFSNAILDSTNARQINNAPVVKMAAGQSISFDAGNQNRLYFDTTTNTVRLQQGIVSFPIGRGITVGIENVFSSSNSIPNYIAGNIIFLVGSGSYVLTLPKAVTVAPGTGFTFSNIGSAVVTISAMSGDVLDNSPLVLHPNDRYHVVSDGTVFWREVFRSNAVSPTFSGPVVLASFTVGNLPTGQSAGAKAFASNGRKPGEISGNGTGVEVFFDGSRWISSCSGTAVVA